MSDIDKVIKVIRPSLRVVAPLTYYFTIGFGTLNILIGLFLIFIVGGVRLELLGLISLNMWAVLFICMGMLTLYFLFINNWKVTRIFALIGVGVKAAWWLELLSVVITNNSKLIILVKALLLLWSFLLYFQIFTYIHFSPRVPRDSLRR